MAKRHLSKKRTLPIIRIGEFATPERRKRLGGVITEAAEQDTAGKPVFKRHRGRIECMLDYYFQKCQLSEAQYTAGLKFREIYLRVNYGINYKLVGNPFIMEARRGDPEGKMHAHIECTRQLSEVYTLLSVSQKLIVRDVCGHDEYAGKHAKKKTLLRALDILAKHWGYAQ